MTYDAILAERAARANRDRKNKENPNYRLCDNFEGIERIKCVLRQDIECAGTAEDLYKICTAFCQATEEALIDTIKAVLPNPLKDKLANGSIDLVGIKIEQVNAETGKVVNSIAFGECKKEDENNAE